MIGFLPLLDIFGMPLVGMARWGWILYTLVAGIRLPGNFPGVFAAILAGTILYYILGPLGWAGGRTRRRRVWTCAPLCRRRRWASWRAWCRR